MVKADKRFPRVIEAGGHVTGIELIDGVFLRWSRSDGGVWTVHISTAPELGGVDLRGVSVEPAVH
jgi:hypothetical protein